MPLFPSSIFSSFLRAAVKRQTSHPSMKTQTHVLLPLLFLAAANFARAGDFVTVQTDAFRLDLRPSPRATCPSRTEWLAYDVGWSADVATAGVLAIDGTEAEPFQESVGAQSWSPDRGGLYQMTLSFRDADGQLVGEPLSASFIAPEESILRRLLSGIRVAAGENGENGGTIVELGFPVDSETGWHTVFTCTNLVEQAWVAAEDSCATSVLLEGANPATIRLSGWPDSVRFFTLVTSFYRSFKRGDPLP